MELFDNITLLDEEEYASGKSSQYGCFPNQRTIPDLLDKGIINLDKPAGPTSHEVVSIVKKILGISKAGHSGTLDPQVTGVLPIALQSGTRFLQLLLLSQKTYICNMFSHFQGTKEELSNKLSEFTGPIFQVPPLKSNVVRKLRTRKVYDLELLDWQKNEILFKVSCQAGTYIRTLCTDFGRANGVSSYMKELRRIRTGPFNENTVTTLHQVFDAWNDFKETGKEAKLREIILPIESALLNIPKIIVKDSAINSICHGSNLKIPGIAGYSEFKNTQWVGLMTSKGELIGIGIAEIPSNLLETTTNGIAVSPKKIIMKRNTYRT